MKIIDTDASLNRIDQRDVLNHQELNILGAILEAADKGEPSPSLRELCALTGINSLNGVDSHIRRLKRIGLLKATSYQHRTLVPACKFLYVKERSDGRQSGQTTSSVPPTGGVGSDGPVDA